MQKNSETHIGKLICERLKKDGRTKKWLAEQMHCEYSCFCKTLKKQHLDTDFVLRISLILQQDFFSPLSKHIAKMANLHHDCGK